MIKKLTAKTVDEDPAGVNVEPLEKRSNLLKFNHICKPEESWYDQPKYCYGKAIHVIMISFAVVFGLTSFLVFSSRGPS